MQVLEDSSRWFYSVETPTYEVFRETGKKDLSARTDVSLYEVAVPSVQSKKVNIELKANNPPVEHFRKDFEKLAREGLDGVWFHLLKNADSGTLPSVFQKIRESFRALKQHLVGKPRFILFAFCVLDVLKGQDQRLLQGVLEIGDPWQHALDGVERLFGPTVGEETEAWNSFKPTAVSAQLAI